MTPKELEQVLKRADVLCRERGVTLTDQRRKVLRLLCESNQPLTAYELLERMKRGSKTPAPTVVYRALDFLWEQGLVHKIQSLHAWVGCSHPEHPHSSQFLICEDCGEVAELEDPQLSQSLEDTSAAAGFQTTRPIVELFGTCAQCSRKDPTESD